METRAYCKVGVAGSGFVRLNPVSAQDYQNVRALGFVPAMLGEPYEILAPVRQPSVRPIIGPDGAVYGTVRVLAGPEQDDIHTRETLRP